ncbi:MAG: hypothetical protein QM708_13490 [Propioniciclava sp.]|uniref:hypothetical protein n=1 Tax=Propioniciclava sp. TaxID=2038686 RepID=UPI0039E65C7E
MNADKTMPLRSLVAGIIMTGLFLGAWLVAEQSGVDSSPIWVIAGPVILGLLIGEVVGSAGRHAAQAANQTNGQLDARIKAAVAAALADRDSARTRQAQGDINSDSPFTGITSVTAKHGTEIAKSGA